MISRKALQEFWEREPGAEEPLRAWYAEAKSAHWTTPADVKAHYRHASILKNKRVVFNIHGNTYRLIVAISYSVGIVLIKFVGTHAEYDEIDAETV